MNSNTLNLNILEKHNIVCISLVNAIMYLNSIGEPNILDPRKLYLNFTLFEIMIFVRNWLEFQSLLNACQSVTWKYCYKLDFVPFVCTATLNCHGTFDMLEIGAEIEYAILSKLVCNVLDSFTLMAKCTLMCAWL